MIKALTLEELQEFVFNFQILMNEIWHLKPFMPLLFRPNEMCSQKNMRLELPAL